MDSRACLDTRVLRHAYLRDVLLALGDRAAQLYQPVWGPGILGRLQWDLVQSGLSDEIQAADLLTKLKRVEGANYDPIPQDGLELRVDLESADVIATAFAAEADTIVTEVVGDIPSEVAAEFGIETVQSQNDFLLSLFFDRSREFCQILAQQAATYLEDLISFSELLRLLARAGAPSLESAVLERMAIMYWEEQVEIYRETLDED